MNNVNLIGRLTRDAELKYTGGGLAIASFSLAVNQRKRQGDKWVDEAHYFDCTLFGKQAESLQQYLTRGKQVGITGRLQQERWERDGQKRSKVSIVVNEIDLLGGQERPRQQEQPQRSEAPEHFEGDSFDDEKIPF